MGREARALAPDEQGELEFCLRNPKRARLFYRHAKHPDWLEWAEQHGQLQSLFSFEGDQQPLWERALWFTEDPLGPRGKVALRIVLKSLRPVGGALSALACQQVHAALREREVVESPDAQTAAAWATVLIERTDANSPAADLGPWLVHLSPQDHPQLMIQILGHVLHCRPMSREGWSSAQDDGLGLSFVMRHSAGGLRYDWEQLRPRVGALAWPMVPVLTEVLESRWRRLVSLEATIPINDPWSWDRSWVEPPPGEADSPPTAGAARHDEKAGLLLDIGKAVLDHLEACAAEKAALVIELWLAASAPQLVQLGLYGLAKASRWKPGKKIEILVTEYLPAKLPFKVEVFRVLRDAYPRLSQRQRERFLKRAEKLYRHKQQDEPDRDRSTIYEWFNVLVWLNRSAPEDPLLDRAIAAVHEIYPEFQPRDHPELDIQRAKWGYVRPKSHLTSEEIARLSLSQWYEELAAAGDRIEHARGFLEETARAASEHFEWGLSFARALLDSDDLEHRGWSRVLTAWGSRNFRPSEWARLLQIVDRPKLLAAQTSGVAALVRGRVEQSDPEPSLAMVCNWIGLAEKLLPHAEAIPFTILSDDVGWLEQAISHPGGQLAEILILSCGRLLGPNPQAGCGIPRPCRRPLEAMMVGRGVASAMGRVVLASRVHYFIGIDPTWARARLLPLFDWDRDTTQAVQAWHGFLVWGRLGAVLLEALTPAAVQLASHLEDLGRQRRQYGKLIATAAFHLPDDPIGKAWFQAFLDRANDADRAQFTIELARLLESLRPEQRAETWRDWLKRYLERRAQFPPWPEAEELAALFGWSVALPAHLAELVECLEALPGEGTRFDKMLLWKLERGELPDSDPNLLARLVLVLLKRSASIEPWKLSSLEAVIRRLIDEGANEKLIHGLVEKYAEHGGGEHQELLKVLEARGSR